MSEIKIVAQNKKARHEYFILETVEAGMVLKGTEVKAMREGKANLVDSYVTISKGEAWLVSCNINVYEPAKQFNHAPTRTRKLLLHKKEIARLTGQAQEKGLSVIPLKLYFRGSRAKVEIGVAKGKKLHDKRATIKEREAKREIDRAIRSNR